MLGYADEEALALTLNERRAVFWSRSRQEIWRKGDTSGSTILLRGAYLDCDLDTVVYDVEAPESACHTGSFSCFGLPTIGE